ncbi:MAG: nucleoside triphosphate pyrophosphohydrolase [Bacteroidales bacterium]|nr:nucleoside triphosphate pyrophosphohydrolase [Bacteroidales bacterium]MCR4857479.1 nucleoside triphosphate pyrophosphohydrolase [Bacteroidales bacterium]
MDERLVAFQRLLDIMDELREKCPWDSVQTFDTLRCLTIEETYELSEAIVDKNYKDMCKELGDLMLHLVFYSKIASEQQLFDIKDVLNQLCDKLIRRHPHIYGEAKAQDAQQVHENWEKIKLQREGNRSVLGGVPTSAPSLVKAYRIQEKANGVGFDWHNAGEVWEKVEEELQEFKDEIDRHSDKAEEEFGDVLFALVNYARFVHINPDDALEKTNRKFIRRFQYIEEQSQKIGKKLTDLSLEQMEEYWQQAKQLE